jgi:TonB family protein
MAVWMLAALEAWSLQVAVLVGILWGTLALIARCEPRVRLAAWQSALVTSLLLPLTAWLPGSASPEAAVPGQSALAVALGGSPVVPIPSALDWPAWLLAGLAAGLVVRAGSLAGGWMLLRRRVRGIPEARSPVFDELRLAMGAVARVRWSGGRTLPFTVGLRPADIILPRSLESAPPRVLRAVLTHELLHVSRGDWRWVVAEEIFRTVLWFHPAAWLLVAEARQAREEVVDGAVVERLGSRRDYMATLLAFADPPSSGAFGPALAFFRSRQLARRIAALASGGSMTTRRLVLTSVLTLGVSAVGITAGARAFPVPNLRSARDAAPAWAVQAGPLEQRAYASPKDAAPPRRLTYKEPEIPADGLQPGQSAVFGIRLVLDATGHVAEARVLTADVKGSAGEHHERRDLTDRLSGPVLDAVRHWVFEPPSKAPLAMTTALTVESPERTAGRETEVSEGVTKITEGPMAVTIPVAEYPEDAKKAGVQGSVEVEVTIDPTGHVTDVRVTKSVPMLDDAAVAAARASTFRPGMKDRHAVTVVVTLTFAFRLK